MKLIPKTIALMGLLIGGTLTSLQAKTYSVFTTSKMSPPDKAKIYEAVLPLALHKIEPGDTIRIHCGNSMAPIATLSCPSHRLYQNDPARRVKKMAPEIKRFQAWVKASPRRDERKYSLDIPACLRFAGEKLPRDPKGEAVMLIGSPILRLSAHPEHHFIQEGKRLHPLDGFLSSDDPVLGTQAMDKDLLKGVPLYWSYLAEPWKKDKGWKVRVDRWWQLYAGVRGTHFAMSDTSLPLVLEAMVNNQQSKRPEYQLTKGALSRMGQVERARTHIVVNKKPVPAPAPPEPKVEPKTEVVAIVFDGSTSMKSRRAKVARWLRKRAERGDVLWQGYVYYDYDRLKPKVAIASHFAESTDPKVLARAVEKLPIIGGKTMPEAGNEGLICMKEHLEKNNQRVSAVEIFSDERPLNAKEHPSDRASFDALTSALIKDGVKVTYHWMGKGRVRWTPPKGVILKKH